MLCREPISSEAISLRGGTSVHTRCLSARTDKVNLLLSKIQDLENRKPDKNIWDTIGTGIVLVSIISFILALFVHFLISFAVAIIGIILYGKAKQESDKTNEPFKNSIRTEIEHLNGEKSATKHELQLIYEQYFEIPPDWGERCDQVIIRDNGVCRKCGRKMHGSVVPFHIHHIIPKSDHSGNHSLNNLELLCEICHSKVDQQGHQLIRGARKKRLQTKRQRGEKSRIPRKNIRYHVRTPDSH